VEIELRLPGAEIEVEIDGLRGVAAAIGIAAAVTAVATELSKPAAERAWHGELHLSVPYDFRPPTPRRLRDSVWRPGDPRIMVPTAFGVGWTINVAALAARVGLDGGHEAPASESEPEH
jgi:hypothetical protein